MTTLAPTRRARSRRAPRRGRRRAPGRARAARAKAAAVLLAGAILIAGAALIACGGGGEGGGGAPAALGPDEGPSHPNVGRLAPDFAVQDPSGPWLPLASLHDKPLALLFFRTGAPMADELVREFGLFRDDRSFLPTVFLGLDLDSLDRIKDFIRIQNISLPIMRDPGSVARSFGAGDLPTVVLLDGQHIVRFQLSGYLGSAFRPRLLATAAALRSLPGAAREAAEPLDLAYAEHPKAPVFTARDLDGRRVDLASLRGRVVVLNFFDQDCPHCQKDLPRLVPVLKEFRSRGVLAIGVTSRDLGGGLRRYLKDHAIDYPVVVDAERAIFKQYDAMQTPDTFLIDADGFVRFHEEGDRPDRGELTRLQLRLLLGKETPAALAASLPRERYVGDGMCRACHLREYRDWLLTPHSIAWQSLQPGEKWRDPECVSCHVTGRSRPGGFSDPAATPHMTGVQCEVCHGPGGGHASGGRPDAQAMGRACVTCHTGKFVLNFPVDEALALVAHQDHPDMDRLFRYSGLQRQRLEEINKRRLARFKTGVGYVGAQACRDCHQSQYQQWSETPHASAFARLIQVGRNYDGTCTPCHTTGSGLPGGFGKESLLQPAMTNVQCEVCHGPGADHVKAPRALKKETIYGITDQCSFCIIQGLCATCHDRANDPRFDIERALPKVKHGAVAG